jgi:hypothetical protein
MKKTGILFAITIANVFISCRPSDTHNHIETMNFDNLKSWGFNGTLTDEKARSGRWATFVDSTHEYSLTYERLQQELLDKGYKKVEFSAWVKNDNPVHDIKAVLTLDSPTGVNYRWQGAAIDSATSIDENGWKKVSVSMELMKEVPEAHLKAYFWSPKKEKLIIDDINIDFH